MKNSLLYGFLLALAAFLLMLILFICGLQSDPAHLTASQWIGGLGGLALGITFLVLGIRAAREATPADQSFGYGRAFGAGFGVQAFASLFGAVTTYAYVAFINPHFTEVVQQAQADKMEARGLSSEQIERMQAMTHAFFGPAGQAISNAVFTLIFGTIIVLIAAAFLKRPGERDPLAL